MINATVSRVRLLTKRPGRSVLMVCPLAALHFATPVE
jgi:hypothetical protein